MDLKSITLSVPRYVNTIIEESEFAYSRILLGKKLIRIQSQPIMRLVIISYVGVIDKL